MRRIILSFAIMAACTACLRQEDAPVQKQPVSVSIVAGADTKVTMHEGAVKWEDGDKVAVVFDGDEGRYVEEFVTEIEGGLSKTATFTGSMDPDVKVASGYTDQGYVVYPSTAVTADGALVFELPSVQTASASGTFPSGLNLASAAVSLSDINEDGHADVQFRNALSVLRVSLSSDVSALTITGTSPFAGKAPLSVNYSEDNANGRLVVDAAGEWSNSSTSITLVPADGAETFADGVVHNILIWPGTHGSLDITMTFKGLADYRKSVNKTLTFEPSKYYSLNFNSEKEPVIAEITGPLDEMEGQLPGIDDRLDELDERVQEIIAQIQSVALMSEYTDNSVPAPYADFSTMEKQDIVLDYVVRPASAVKALVDKINGGEVELSSVMTAMVYYRAKDEALDLSKDLLTPPVRSVAINGDVMTVAVDPSIMSDQFYQGLYDAELILQIGSGSTDVASDVAKLIPVEGAGIRGNYIKDIPVPAGVEVSVPFSYSAPSDDYSLSVAGKNVGAVNVIYNRDFKTGYLTVEISEEVPVSEQSVDMTLTVGGNSTVKTFTFAEAGKLTITTDGPVDHIGGDIVVSVERNDFKSGILTIHNDGGTGVSQSNMVFTFQENTSYSARTATARYSVSNGSLTYSKYVDLVQYGTSTPLRRSYYSNDEKLMLNTASGQYRALNVVILGDGYKKKDLAKGGKFERSAVSAVSTLFSVEPFRSFEDRFNVIMVAYESAEEGPDITSAGISKDTYFNSSFTGGGNTYATSDKNKVVDVVKNTVGLSSDADFYRTIVLLLVNSDENAGSTDYTSQSTISTGVVGDGYASFSIATLSANSTATNGLIKHECGGHGFGRLGDEYSQSWYTPDIINQRHGVGFYFNVATTSSYWSAFTTAGYSSSEVGYHTYMTGMYRSTDASGIMWNNNGSFNAVSRWAIYDRIRKQTEGYGNYWSDFLIYDKINR